MTATQLVAAEGAGGLFDFNATFNLNSFFHAFSLNNKSQS